ncbi:EP1-like glycoprotein 3 [Linum grandiflorum]
MAQLLVLLSLCFLSSSISYATVPPSSQFSYVNEGEFGPYIVEYDASYRILPIARTPFQLFFYNTTPGDYTLAVRMGLQRSEATRRFVWEANRGNPVGENATFSFGSDGNLVLAQSDGRIAWQSNTAGKGVVRFEMLPSGNMVLYDAKGKSLWESFDFATDTLLVGQSLRVGATTRLVSRASEKENKNGPYSLVLEPNRLALYYTTQNTPKPYPYYTFYELQPSATFTNVTLNPYLGFDFQVKNGYNGTDGSFKNPRFNATLSYLRLGIDGNLQIFTYSYEVHYWEKSLTFFSEDDWWAQETKCQLPDRCGEFGVCENSQCVGCPTASGTLSGWSEDCRPPKVTSCRVGGFRYYEMRGIDHFMVKYSRGDGPVKKESCESKCSKDCKCLGYFYHTDSSRCWIAYELKTMTRVANSTHLAYIKAPL